MAKSRQEKLDELFLLFLEGNGIKKRFFEEYERMSHRHYNSNPLPARYNSISCAFEWRCSKEGHYFWKDYSDMWKEVWCGAEER